MSELFKGFGVPVTLVQDFNVVREMLSRIGFANHTTKVLYQSCHIFHKQQQYAIVHFKELFAFDGKPADITEDDIARRNTIVDLLVQWNAVKMVTPSEGDQPKASMSKIAVVKHKDRGDWTFVQKYGIGG